MAANASDAIWGGIKGLGSEEDLPISSKFWKLGFLVTDLNQCCHWSLGGKHSYRWVICHFNGKIIILNLPKEIMGACLPSI